MERIEGTFLVRFSLEVDIPAERLEDDDFDERAWRGEWEKGVKPAVVRAVFDALRASPGWAAHVRNRGASTEDEIEIVVRRSY
ncbi:MAG: hypothetical protein FJ144_10965 [Deltaproteobacteria bacterium]|nr:hypothetical protein [Deltaproteobacteria bacterium]